MTREPLYGIVWTGAGLEIVPSTEVPRLTSLLKKRHAEEILTKLRADGCEACRAGSVVLEFGPGSEF